MKEKKALKKRNFFLIALFLTILLIQFIAAADVAYIYRSKPRIDNNILGVFSEMGLSYDLINEKNLPKNFSSYRFIFVGDERFTKNIPVNDYPSVVINYYFGEEWSLTDKDGISKLASNSPLSVNKNGEIIQVYTQGVYDSTSLAIPYYYLGNNDKTFRMQQIASTYSGNVHNLGDVISYANAGTVLNNGKNAKSNVCFFGIVSSKYWTDEAVNMFKECINFVSSECSTDNECPADKTSEPYCKNDDVYQDIKDFYCKNPGTSLSQCANNIISELLTECNYGCENGECLPQCILDIQCSADYYSVNYCFNNSVYRDLHDFSCENEECKEEIIKEIVEECADKCLVNECVNITCYNDSECNDNNSSTFDKCINPGTVDSYCINENIICSQNSDCGEDGFIDNPFCDAENVFQDYQTFNCKNPGTVDSFCSDNVTAMLKQECLESETCINGECKGVACNEDSDCDDDNLYTHDECNNPGTSNSYCTNTLVNCVINNDCGPTGFIGNEFCSSNDVVKFFQNSTCVNPKTLLSYCDISVTQTLLKNCGENSCEDYGENFCKNGDVYHSRTCHENQCIEGACINYNHNEENLVEECNNGCSDGACTGECSLDNDCGNESYSENYCENSNVARDHLIPECMNSICSIINQTEIIENCQYGCENGECLSQKIHDVALIDFKNSFGGIKLEKIDGTDIIETPAQLNCNQQYKIWIDVKNKGNFYENVTFNGSINSLLFNHNPKDNLAPQEDILKYKVVNMTLSSGLYDLIVNAMIPIDNNLSNNIAKRQIKIICSDCEDNDNDNYDTCNPGEDNDDGKPKDCNDEDANIYPNAPEICNGIDDDCDGLIDENNGYCSEDEICINGECKEKVCYTNEDCEENQFCELNSCSSDKGSCIAVPEICLALYEPVCGCDGKTYTNDCFRAMAKVTKSHDGECDINCDLDSDCGINEFIGDLFCQNGSVFQDYQTFKCNNPGTENSHCTDNIEKILKQECSTNEICSYGECILIECKKNSDCNDNNPKTIDKCNNPGTIQSYCTNEPVNCKKNSDCGNNGLTGDLFCKLNNVYQNFIEYKCNNPGTANSYCSHNTSSKLFEECEFGMEVCANGQCKEIICSEDLDCDDDNLYTHDECNNPGTANSYCSHDFVNCVTNNDCGPTGFIGFETCAENNVVKFFQNSTCNNPGTMMSYCEISIAQILINDCGEDYCTDYGENYCKNGDVYHSRTCNEKGCLDGTCFSINSFVQKELVAECEHGCSNGMCTGECSLDNDCGNESYSDNYCYNGNVVRKHFIPKCINSGCSIQEIIEIIEICLQECEDGECISTGIHDVALVDFKNSFGGIKLETINGTNILEHIPTLRCGETIKAKVKVLNRGEFSENVMIKGNVDGINFTFANADNLNSGASTFRNSLFPYIKLDLSSGLYDLIVNAMIPVDNNLSNNIAKRQIKIVCEENTCNEAEHILDSIYSAVNGGTNSVSMDQSKTSASCDNNDILLAGAGETPVCDNANTPFCGHNINYEFNGPKNNLRWQSFYKGEDNRFYDTVREEAICLPADNSSRYFSVYIKSTGTGADKYSLDQGNDIALCNVGDKVISGGGYAPFCDSNNPACGKIQYLEYNIPVKIGNQEGWRTSYDLFNNAVYDTVQTFAVCLKKTSMFDDNFKIYNVYNQGVNSYELDQDRTIAYCNYGDIAIGGGGNAPLCDFIGDPACGKIQYLEGNRKIINNGVQGWKTQFDLTGNPVYDTQRVAVVCLGLADDCES